MALVNFRNVQNKVGYSFNAGSLNNIYAEDYLLLRDSLAAGGSSTGSEVYVRVYNVSTAARNAIPVAGSGALVFNTDYGSFEYYNGSGWITVGTGGTTIGSYLVLPGSLLVNDITLYEGTTDLDIHGSDSQSTLNIYDFYNADIGVANGFDIDSTNGPINITSGANGTSISTDGEALLGGGTSTSIYDGTGNEIIVGSSGTIIKISNYANTGSKLNINNSAFIDTGGNGSFWGSLTTKNINATYGSYTGSIVVNSILFDTINPPTAHSEGNIHWNGSDKTLEVDTEVVGVHLQVGQEMYIRATNKSGVDLKNGTVVFINGAQGNRPTIERALADNSGSAQLIGVITHDIDNNNTGYVTTFGLVSDVDTSSYPVGSKLYLSATTPGSLTLTAPSAPNYPLCVGITTVSDSTVGKILVNPDPTDVTGSMVINSLTVNNQVIAGSTVSSGVILPNLFVATGEPTGFADRTATLSLDQTNRLVYITGSHTIYVNGSAYHKNTGSAEFANSNGKHFIYYDASGSLQSGLSFPGFNVPFAALVYWNVGSQKGMLSEERHGITMDSATHEYLHETVGTRYESGLGASVSAGSIVYGSGFIHDEDLRLTLAGGSSTCVLYMNGSTTYTWTPPQDNFYLMSGTDIAYNSGSTIAAATTNQYVAYWIFATNIVGSPFVSLMGQRVDTLLADARANNTYESLSLGTLPSNEMKLLYRVLMRDTGSPPSYIETQDYRTISNLPAGTYVATDHGILTGLTDDDHTQYVLADGARAMTNLSVTGSAVSGSVVTTYGSVNSNFITGQLASVGSVLIGTTTPSSATLKIATPAAILLGVNNSSDTKAIIRLNNANTDATPSGGINFYRDGSYSGQILATAALGLFMSGSIVDQAINGATKTRVFQSGSFSIGTTDSGANALLNTAGTGSFWGSVIASYGVIPNLLPQGVLPYGSLTASLPQGVLPYGSLTAALPQGVLPTGSIPSLSGTYIPQGQLISGSLPTNPVITGSYTGLQFSAYGSVVGSFGSFTVRMTAGSVVTAYGSSTGSIISSYNKTTTLVASTGSLTSTLTADSINLTNGNASTGSINNQILMGWAGTETFRHSIKTKHSGANEEDNTIDFYLWTQADVNSGSVGTKHLMTLEGTGSVGINGVKDPVYTLDVYGTIAGSNIISIGSVLALYGSYNDKVVAGSFIGYGGDLTGLPSGGLPQGIIPYGSLVNALPQGVLPTGSIPSLSASYIPQGAIPYGSVTVALPQGALPYGSMTAALPQGVLPTGSIPSLSASYIPQGAIPYGSVTVALPQGVLPYGSLTAAIPQGQLISGSLPTNPVVAGSYTGLGFNAYGSVIGSFGSFAVRMVTGSFVGTYGSSSGSIIAAYGVIPNLLPQGVLPTGSIPSLSGTYIPQGAIPYGSVTVALPQGVLPTGSIPSLSASYIPQGAIPYGSVTVALPQGVLPYGSLTAAIPQGQLISGSLPTNPVIAGSYTGLGFNAYGSVIGSFGSFAVRTITGSLVTAYGSSSGSIIAAYGVIPNLLPQGVLPTGSIPSLSASYIPQGAIPYGSVTVALPQGQIPVGSLPTNGSFAGSLYATGSIYTAGSFYGYGGTLTGITASALTWNEVTGTSQAMSVNNGYIANNGARVNLTLPSTAAIGNNIKITGKGAGGWQVTQNASQQIFFGMGSTTSGVNGSLQSTQTYDSIEIVCTTANNGWNVINSIGNITII